MFSLSLRQPIDDFIDSTADCFVPLTSPAMMDIELPVMMRQMEGLSRNVFGDHQAKNEGEKEKPRSLDLKLALRGFRPEDIKVTAEGSNVIVEAKREEKKEDDGSYSYTFQEFKRTYPIPEGVDKTKMTSAYTKNGILEIEAPLFEGIEAAPTKTSIEITHANGDCDAPV